MPFTATHLTLPTFSTTMVAVMKVSVYCLLVLLFLSPSVFSRTLNQIPKTSVFDVSASIQKTIDILSPQPFQQQQDSQGSVSSFSVNLYPRATLHKPASKTYRDLTLSRLKRDSIRVNFLYRKLNSARRGNKSTEFEPTDVEVPLTSGLSQDSGEYFARLGLGTPAKQVFTAIDTGSDVTWVQCAPCTNCYKQTDPIFDPSMSSSFKPLTCDSRRCQQLPASGGGCDTRSNTCQYQVSYGDGSFTTGDYATETLMFGKSAINDFAFGCGHDNEGLFVGAAGLLGLGRSPVSLPSQIKSTSFSYCLVDRDTTAASTLEFGSPVTNDAVTARLLSDKGRESFYYVDLTGISVGGQMLPISPSAFAIDASGNGGVIVDSGTTVTRFGPEVYNPLRDAFVEGTKGPMPVEGDSLFDTCYDLSSKPSVEFPTVAFHFGAKSLVLPAKNVLLAVDNGVFCLGFAAPPATASQGASLSIIGNYQQQGIRVSFDVGRSLIGFSPNSC